MKVTPFATFLTLLFASTLYLLTSFDQVSPQWNLPEDAKMRLGKRFPKT